MQYLLSYFLHLVLFGAALGLGGIFTSRGLASDWYAALTLPSWQPPSWTFGTAWTLIMFSFPVAMAYLLPAKRLFSLDPVALVYWGQWLLNVGWNFVFFQQHQAAWGLLVIVALAVTVAVLGVVAWRQTGWTALAVLPYMLWLCVATALNGSIWRLNGG